MSRPSLLLFAAFLPDASLPSSSLSAASLACPPLRVRGGFPSSLFLQFKQNHASSSHLESFFIFLQLFHFFTLLVAPSSSSLLPPRPSFLLVPLSSLSLFLPRPELSESFRIRKRPFFTEFDESVTDRRTDGPTDRPTK